MCTIFVGVNQNREYPLVIIGNRDEFTDRPSMHASFWEKYPHILAGKDLKEGGTWMGITKHGYFAALTNYRDPNNQKKHAPSRGKLVRDFLIKESDSNEYFNKIIPYASMFNGFNFIFGTVDHLSYYSNKTLEKIDLVDGIYGLSNHILDTPWPKVEKGKKLFKQALQNQNIVPSLFHILSDSTIYPDSELPKTGVTLEQERMLSSLFITGTKYGTRSSTIILVNRYNSITFLERTYILGNRGYQSIRYEFEIEVK